MGLYAPQILQEHLVKKYGGNVQRIILMSGSLLYLTELLVMDVQAAKVRHLSPKYDY